MIELILGPSRLTLDMIIEGARVQACVFVSECERVSQVSAREEYFPRVHKNEPSNPILPVSVTRVPGGVPGG